MPPSQRQPTTRETPIAGPGIGPGPRRAPTRRSRPNSNGRRRELSPAAASAAAAAFLQRAVALTAEPNRRAERALAAAEASFQAGAFDAVQRLLATAESHGLDGLLSARALLLRGHLAVVLGYGDDAAPLLLQAAKKLEPFDIELAREHLPDWPMAPRFAAAHLGQAGVFLEICRADRRPPSTGRSPRMPSALLLEGLARMHTDGRAVAIPILQAGRERARPDSGGGRPALGVDGSRWPTT